MAIDAYCIFIPYTGNMPESESQVDFSKNQEALANDLKGYKSMQLSSGKISAFGQIFEIEDYSFDIEQTLNIGSQSGGTGAGKAGFNPFSITRKVDRASPVLFEHCCGGTAFKQVILAIRKSGGESAAGSSADMTSGVVYLRYDFKLVAVKTISWSHDDEAPKETITFEYGGLLIRYNAQNPDGSMYSSVKQGGWNKIKNRVDQTTDPL